MFGKKKSYIMTVEGMMCAHCAGKVKSSLEKIAGVKVEVNIENKTASIKAPSGTDINILSSAVEDAGYTVVAVKEIM